MSNLDNPEAMTASELSFLQAPLTALSRKQREFALDQITDGMKKLDEIEKEELLRKLAVIAHIMQVPNSTAEIVRTTNTAQRTSANDSSVCRSHGLIHSWCHDS